MPKREVQRKIDVSTSAATGGVVYGSGLPNTNTLPVHDLNGPAHRGFLSPGQAPDFALLDGTRAYTGDLNIGGHNIVNVALVDGYDMDTFNARITTLEGRRVIGGAALSDSGNTLLQGDITLNVNAGYGIVLTGATVPDDAVSVDRTYPFDWLAMHKFSAYLQTERVYALADLNLVPNADLAIDPTSDIAKVMPNTTLKSSQAQSGVLGWQIDWDGNADFRDIYADSLTVEVFISDVNLALAGSQIISKSLGTLSRTFTVPAAVNGTATLYVYDLPGLEDTQVFEVGDWVRLRYVDRRNGGLKVGNAWGTVTNYVDLTNGEQSWTFTYKGGSNNSAGQTVFAGMVALDYGTSGSGQWHVTTLELDSPYWEISTWSGADPMAAGNFKVWTRGGQLKGITSIDEWGIWAGNITSDKWVKAGSNGVTLHNADLSIVNGNFYAGNQNQTQYVSWNGTNLIIRGNLLLPTGETVLGPGMTWRGTWATGTNYNKYDAVAYNGRSYLTSATHTSTPTGTNGPPGVGIYWTLIADQGATGATGSQGATGPQGPPGPPGSDGADNQDFPFLIAAEASIDPAYNGLMITSEKMGYVAAGHFKTYQDNAGNFVFGTGATNRLFWNQATGKLGGVNSSNVTQWYASASDGKIYAGVDQVVMSAYGLDLGIYTGRPNPTDNVKAVAFWNNPATEPSSSTPVARVYGGLGGAGATNMYLQLEAGTGSGDPKLWLEKDAPGIGSHVWISNAKLLVSGAVTLYAGGRSVTNWETQGHLVPVTTKASDIGTPSLYYRAIYVDQLVTNTIVGTPQQSHMHDDRYYTESEVTATFAPLVHTHAYLSATGGTMTGGLTISTGAALPLNLITSSATPWGLTLTRSDLGNTSSVRNTGSAWSFEHAPKVGANVIWHAGNDGVGSGLDGDMVDGLHAAAFAQLAADNDWTGGNRIVIQNSQDGGATRGLYFWTSSNNNYGLYMASAGAARSLAGATSVAGLDARTGYAVRLRVGNSASEIGFLVENASEQALFQIQPNTGNVYGRGQFYAGNSTANLVWHAGNDGSGSGLDADTLDTFHEATFMRKSANSDLNMNNFSVVNVNNLDATTGTFDSTANPALTVGNGSTGYLKLGAGALYDDGVNFTYNGPRSFYVTANAPNTYIYSPNIYLGDVTGAAIHLRGNTVDSDNADLTYALGRGVFGYLGHANYVGISHRDYDDQASYALLQGGITTGGFTFLNAPTGSAVLHRIANLDVMQMNDQRLMPAGSILKDLGDYNRKWRTLYAGELYVEQLVAQKVMATIGGRITVAPTTKLIADVNTTQTTVDVQDNNLFGGDYIYLMTAPGGLQQIEVMQVFGAGVAITGGYRFTVVRNKDGTGANSWVAGDAVISLAGGGALMATMIAQMTNTQCTIDVNATLNNGYNYFLLTPTAYEVILVVNNGTVITGGRRYFVIRNAQNAESTSLLNNMSSASQTTMDTTSNALASGDYVCFYVNGIPVSEMVRVTSSASSISGGYRYSISRAQSGTAMAWSAGALLYKSTQTWANASTLHNYSQRLGRGYLDLTSTSTIHNHLGPTMAVYSRTNVNAWSDVVPVAAFGNLRSFVDYQTDMFGWAVGNNLTLGPTNGFQGLTADIWNGLRLFNVNQRFYTNGALFLSLDANAGLSLYANQNSPDYSQRGVSWHDPGSDLRISGIAGFLTPTATNLNINAGAFALGLDAYLTLSATPASGRSAQVGISAYTTDANRAFATYVTGPTGSYINLLVANGYIHLQNNDVRMLENSLGTLHFTQTWSAWPDTGAYHAEICNEITSAFGQLMIVGNKRTGPGRGVGVWDRLQIGGVPFYNILNVGGSAWISGALGVGSNVYGSPNGLQVTTPITETGSSFANVRLGVYGSPRIMLEYGSGYTQWEMDNNLGEFRIYTPGTARMTINANGYVSINGATYSQHLNVQGGIRTAGSAGIFNFDDRTGTSPTSWGWYASGGLARLWNNSLGDVLQVSTGAFYCNLQLGGGWTVLALGANWMHYGGVYGNIIYRRFGDMVTLSGLAKVNTSVATTNLLLTLPAGYRPTAQVLFNVMSSFGATRVDIDTGGNLIIQGVTFNTANQWISLAGISFFTT